MSKTLFVSEVYSRCGELIKALESNYNGRYPNSSSPVTFYITEGRKYYKICQEQSGVHAFVDRKTGDVFKPAGWAKPSKYVRYNLLDKASREECLSRADWAGGYLYLR